MASAADFLWDESYVIPLNGSRIGGVAYVPAYFFMAYNPYKAQLYVQPSAGDAVLYAPVNVGQVQMITNAASPGALISQLPVAQ